MFKFPEFVGFSCRWDGNFCLCGVEKVVVVWVIVCLSYIYPIFILC